MEEFPTHNNEGREKDLLEWSISDFERLREKDSALAQEQAEIAISKLKVILAEIPEEGTDVETEEWSFEREKLEERIKRLEDFTASF